MGQILSCNSVSPLPRLSRRGFKRDCPKRGLLLPPAWPGGSPAYAKLASPLLSPYTAAGIGNSRMHQQSEHMMLRERGMDQSNTLIVLVVMGILPRARARGRAAQGIGFCINGRLPRAWAGPCGTNNISAFSANLRILEARVRSAALAVARLVRGVAWPGWERQVHDGGADAVGESGARPASAPCRGSTSARRIALAGQRPCAE